MARPAQSGSVRMPLRTLERHLIEVLDTEIDRLTHEEMIDIRPQPVRVGQLVARTRGNEQLIGSIRLDPIALTGLVLEVCEPALQSADDVRVRALPGPERRQRPQAREVVSIGKLLDEDAGERRRRLADREARMPAALEQHHAVAEPPRDHGQE